MVVRQSSSTACQPLAALNAQARQAALQSLKHPCRSVLHGALRQAQRAQVRQAGQQLHSILYQPQAALATAVLRQW